MSVPSLPDLAQLHAAVEVSTVSVTIADMTMPDAPLSYANAAFLEATGYNQSDIIGRNCRFLQGPDTDPSAVRAMHDAICRGESLEIELLNYRKDGQAFWNRLHLSPVFDPAGLLQAYIGIQHDVTEARAAREAEAHRQRIEALGRMAGGLAHELNNMLQPLMTLPDLVEDALPDDASDAREDLAFMKASVCDARDLVADMLAYARTGSSDKGVLNAREALTKAAQIIERTLCGQVEVRIEFGPGTDALEIAALSQASLQQILVNLAINAADAMDRRGTLIISLMREPRGGALIKVSDQGCGMDAATQARMFDPFFTTKPVGAGAGLGLHVVSDLVRLAQGRVDVLSRPGEGTTIFIHFPPVKQDF
jgi:PAS domain S-box-containing protein